MFNLVKKAVSVVTKEFMTGYRGYQVIDVPTINEDPLFGHDYESQVINMFKRYGLKSDVIIGDLVVPDVVACITADSNLPVMGLDIKSVNKDALIINRQPIVRHYNGLSKRLNCHVFGDFVEIILAHELGHLKNQHARSKEQSRKEEIIANLQDKSAFLSDEEDIRLNNELAHIILTAEQEAWDTGKQYVRTDLLPAYDAFNQMNYDAYIKLFN